MKNTVQNQNLKLTNLILLIAAGIITLGCLMFVWYNTGKPFKYFAYDDIKAVEHSNYLTQKDSEYYVFVYTQDTDRDRWYEEIVVEYANYARTHDSAKKIYVYDFNKPGNGAIQSEIGSNITVGKDIPGLLLIKDGKISTKYLSWTALNNELTKQMNK